MMRNVYSPHDIGFLELRPDGAIRAEFLVTYFCVATDWAVLEANLRHSEFRVTLSGFRSAIPVKFNYRDLQDWLPTEDSYFVFAPTILAASAKNTSTGISFMRNYGVTLLQTRRCRQHRHFVHMNGRWLESDEVEAFSFFEEAVDAACNSSVPRQERLGDYP